MLFQNTDQDNQCCLPQSTNYPRNTCMVQLPKEEVELVFGCITLLPPLHHSVPEVGQFLPWEPELLLQPSNLDTHIVVDGPSNSAEAIGSLSSSYVGMVTSKALEYERGWQSTEEEVISIV